MPRLFIALGIIIVAILVEASAGGVEGGVAIHYVRLSAGVTHRLAGPAGDKAAIFTWGAAVLVPFKWGG